MSDIEDPNPNKGEEWKKSGRRVEEEWKKSGRRVKKFKDASTTNVCLFIRDRDSL
jgi:hypothetical protein